MAQRMSQKICRRHLSSPAQSRKGGPTTIFVIAVALMIPPTAIKVFDVQLDPQIENIVGTLFGTNAVLYLRPSPGRPFSETVKDAMAFIKGDKSAVLDVAADQTDGTTTLKASKEDITSDENLVTDIIDLDIEPKSDIASITGKEIIGEKSSIEVNTLSEINESISSKIQECPHATQIGT